jgi:CRISPR-associated endonuclease/helicase Cas3
LEGRPTEEWQPLEEHLENVANLAAEFAKPFGGEEWARLAGLWHDLGKYSNEFQKKLYDANGIECHLETVPGRPVHSEAGGHLASLKEWRGVDRILSWLIMGHHAGLTDYSSDECGARSLEVRMSTPAKSKSILSSVPERLLNQEIPRQKVPQGADPSLFIRMLFSCVVDADFLDTEAFMDQRRSQLRGIVYPSLEHLLSAFDEHMETLGLQAPATKVNAIRAEVLGHCRDAAEGKSAVYSLSVPTGGGKTLSSMAFALRHAVRWRKKRIIYVIPYTSIIEQTVEVFRRIPGFGEAMLEHHSNVQDEDETKQTRRSRLAAENWDVPIVVTTNVQLFESLYACKTSRCRKLHNLADSVIIFDEAQCLPPELLRPCVLAIRNLHMYYGVTPVLCTATQPVLDKADWLAEGFEQVESIIPDPDRLAKRLKRVELILHKDSLEPVSLDKLAESLSSELGSVLCIVNRKDDARDLAKSLPKNSTVHLSTNMCAVHRQRVLCQIREALERNDRICVISTSLVEAGVDLDFPVVYRALAGLDSIAQAAGRCNREGRLKSGTTFVFVPEEQPKYVCQPADITRELLGASDPLSPESYAHYFLQRYWQLGKEALDKEQILDRWLKPMDLYYRTAADKFRMIDDSWQQPLIIPYEKSPEWVDQLLDWNARYMFRRLQRYTISISKNVMRELIEHDHARELAEYPGTFYLYDQALYSEHYGFIPPSEIDGYDPEVLMA